MGKRAKSKGEAQGVKRSQNCGKAHQQPCNVAKEAEGRAGVGRGWGSARPPNGEF